MAELTILMWSFCLFVKCEARRSEGGLFNGRLRGIDGFNSGERVVPGRLIQEIFWFNRSGWLLFPPMGNLMVHSDFEVINDKKKQGNETQEGAAPEKVNRLSRTMGVV